MPKLFYMTYCSVTHLQMKESSAFSVLYRHRRSSVSQILRINSEQVFAWLPSDFLNSDMNFESVFSDPVHFEFPEADLKKPQKLYQFRQDLISLQLRKLLFPNEIYGF